MTFLRSPLRIVQHFLFSAEVTLRKPWGRRREADAKSVMLVRPRGHRKAKEETLIQNARSKKLNFAKYSVHLQEQHCGSLTIEMRLFCL